MTSVLSNGSGKKKDTYMQSSFCLVVQNSKMSIKKKKQKTGGIVDKNPLANARGHACDPWSRIIPHA